MKILVRRICPNLQIISFAMHQTRGGKRWSLFIYLKEQLVLAGDHPDPEPTPEPNKCLLNHQQQDY
jgi:hypothetical protein